VEADSQEAEGVSEEEEPQAAGKGEIITKMKTSQFFTEEERTKIRECVRRAEAKTSGEIVPIVVEHSADYTGTRLTAGIGGALLGAGMWLFTRPLSHPLWLIAAEGLGFSFALLLFKIRPALLRFFIGESVIENAVRTRARLAFFDHGLYQTRDRTGILILISLLERRVQILADAGIHRKVPQSTWDELVQHLVTGIQQKEAANVLCKIIERCGQILAQHFPRRPDDQNELANQVITG
jgi:putative membrane protein